jgi:hypothetical protein
MASYRFPMIITCVGRDQAKITAIFDRLLRQVGYVKIAEKAYVHQAGEQLTAAINYGRTYMPDIDTINECISLHLSDGEHPINMELCSQLCEVLPFGLECSDISFLQQQ